MEIQPTAAGFPHPHSLDGCGKTYFEPVTDPPAVLRLPRDGAEELLLPMLPSVCFEAGRFTLTQSSWTAVWDRSRQWMSGRAQASATQEIEDCSTIRPIPMPLRESLASSGRGTPSPL